jgi:anti-sigma regulatory factor (Ser/Thr protein kinase)
MFRFLKNIANPRMRISERVKLEDVRSEAVARRVFTELLSRCQFRHHQSDGMDTAVSETVVFGLS